MSNLKCILNSHWLFQFPAGMQELTDKDYILTADIGSAN